MSLERVISDQQAEIDRLKGEIEDLRNEVKRKEDWAQHAEACRFEMAVFANKYMNLSRRRDNADLDKHLDAGSSLRQAMILRDGRPMTISEILDALNSLAAKEVEIERLRAEIEGMADGLRRLLAETHIAL